MRIIMDKKMKAKFRHFAEDVEISAVRSILKWGYKRKGKMVPSDEMLAHQSRKAASLANDTLMNTGKTVWRDLKDVYAKKSAKSTASKEEGAEKGGKEE
jgi:hypothetical protein